MSSSFTVTRKLSAQPHINRSVPMRKLMQNWNLRWFLRFIDIPGFRRSTSDKSRYALRRSRRRTTGMSNVDFGFYWIIKLYEKWIFKFSKKISPRTILCFRRNFNNFTVCTTCTLNHGDIKIRHKNRKQDNVYLQKLIYFYH